jgi:protein-S-isoprenylcysteine O-methyltransferase Ste14
MTLRGQMWIRAVVGSLVLVALVFFPAGRFDYWQGWAYIGLSLIVVLLSGWLLRGDPGLIAERLHPGEGMKSWDKVYYAVSTPLNLIAVAVAGFDAGRGAFTGRLPVWVYASGFVIYGLGQSLFLWSKKANPYFSSVVRIQTDRGQTVCCRGPYRFIRHPGYLAGLLFGLATPLLLGSLWALIPQALSAILLLARTVLEDQTLISELPDYPDYARRVTWRLMPGVW